MTRDELKLLADITEITAEVSALRAENKCLREDRDAWKEYAMRVMPPMPTVAAPAQNIPLCQCPPGTVCMNTACPHRAVIS
jgi:hypothetical protein